MARRCFISYKREDAEYKRIILEDLGVDMVDYSLDEPIDSDDEDYIMQQIRDRYLSDSTVTIHLIGAHGSENSGWEEQKYIKRELQASLYHGKNNTMNGILGIVLPHVTSNIYQGSQSCVHGCGNSHNIVNLNDDTTIREFWKNYYIPHNRCAHGDDDRYCVLVKWEDFVRSPETYIEQAYQKRIHAIASKVIVYPK